MMTRKDIHDLKKWVISNGAHEWTLDTTPMMPESNADSSYGGGPHRFIADAGRKIMELCDDVDALLAEVEQARKFNETAVENLKLFDGKNKVLKALLRECLGAFPPHDPCRIPQWSALDELKASIEAALKEEV